MNIQTKTFEEFLAEVSSKIDVFKRKEQLRKVYQSQYNICPNCTSWNKDTCPNSGYQFVLDGLNQLPVYYEPKSKPCKYYEEYLKSQNLKKLAISLGIPELFIIKPTVKESLSKATAKIVKKIEEYINSSWKDNRHSLYICGDKGVGKSIISAVILQFICKNNNMNGHYIFFPEYLRKLRDSFNNADENMLTLSQIEQKDIIVLDDVGAEHISSRNLNGETSWQNEVLFDIVDYRYRNRKPMIITSQKLPEELKYDQAVIDRINAVSKIWLLNSLSNLRESLPRENV